MHRIHRLKSIICLSGLCAALAGLVPASLRAEEPRSAKHEAYARELWDFVQARSYNKWPLATADPGFQFGPPVRQAKHHLNAVAAEKLQDTGALVVTEHQNAEGQVTGVTVWRKSDSGYHPPSQDWYWAHYLPDGTVVKTCADKSPWAKRGFVAFEEDGRLWVFAIHSSELGEYLQAGELAKHVVRPGAGPDGVTLKAADAETLDEYLKALGH